MWIAEINYFGKWAVAALGPGKDTGQGMDGRGKGFG